MNLRDQIDFHARSERQLRCAERASRMRAALAKNLGEQLRRTIGHEMLFGECWRAVHQAHKLDDSADVVQITDGKI